MAWKRTEPESLEPTYPPRPATPAGPAAAKRERAVIGASISIQGDLSGEEDLTVHGRVQGTVDVKGNNVTIGESGRVKADVYAKTIFVEGEVDGNLFGGDQIVLRSSGKVRGNLTAPRVALEDGAQFKGSIDMEPKRQAGAAGRTAALPGRAGERAGSSEAGSASGGSESNGPAQGSSAGSGEGAAPAGDSARATAGAGGAGG